MHDIIPAGSSLAQARNHTAFDRAAQEAFLRALATSGNVQAAAKRAGVSRATVYRTRQACLEFETLWNAAMLLARVHVEAVLADRAINGVEETVFYHGEEVATRRRYDSRLLLAHLGRLDRLTANRSAREAADAFDYKLEDLRDLPEIGALRGLEGFCEE